ncbi:MAG TPA: hypothetical protein VHV77_12260 [Pirellulales bacterium]|nr:hypothetical protein [Pirellulales bacterium]
MSLGLPDDLAQFVHDAVSRGAYPTEGALLTEAVRLLRQREELRRQVQAGIDELDRGEAIPAETVFERLRKKLAERSES